MAKGGVAEIFFWSKGGPRKFFVTIFFATGPPPLQVFVNGPLESCEHYLQCS